MPRFVARLEAQDGSGHFRRVIIHSPSEEEARAAIERSEARAVGSRLTTEMIAQIAERNNTTPEAIRKLLEADDLDKAFEETPLARDKINIVLHRQTQPYKLVYIGEDDPPRKASRKPAFLRREGKGGDGG